MLGMGVNICLYTFLNVKGSRYIRKWSSGGEGWYIDSD